MNQPQSQGPSSGFDFNYPTIISILYLLSFFTGVTGIIGIILAYIWRSEDASGWQGSHYTYHIRTFWFGMLGTVIGVILTLFFIGIFVVMAAAIWVIIRTVVALLKAQRHEPFPDPRSLWI
jgi:uncharacterized membrane protein